MKFVLEIELGNDAMQTYRDIQKALTVVTGKLEQKEFSPNDHHPIHDVNGNRVGHFGLRYE